PTPRLRHPRCVRRRQSEHRTHLAEQPLLRRPVEIPRNEPEAGKGRGGGHASLVAQLIAVSRLESWLRTAASAEAPSPTARSFAKRCSIGAQRSSQPRSVPSPLAGEG